MDSTKLEKFWKSLLLGATPSSSSSINRTQCDAAPPPLPPLPGQEAVAPAVASKEPPPPVPPPPPGSTETGASSNSGSAASTTTSSSGGGGTASSQPEEVNNSIAAAAASVSAYENPGPYEIAAMEGKRYVTLDCYDGFRCDINKQVSPFMAVVHSFWLGTTMLPDSQQAPRRSTYTGLVQVADDAGLLMARVDPGRGAVDGRIHRALLGGLATAKLQASVSTTGEQDQLLGELDIRGLDYWTANFKYGSMAGGLVYGCNYFQAITPNLSAGAEGMYLAAHQNFMSNYTVKYKCPAPIGKDAPAITESPKPQQQQQPGMLPSSGEEAPSSTFCVNYNTGQAALTCHYKRVVTPGRVTLAAEFEMSPATLENRVVLGAEFQLQRSKLHLVMDGNLKMQSLLEAKLGMAPGSPTLTLSADVDHLTQDAKFGYGINVGG